jgi:hypothetical protein
VLSGIRTEQLHRVIENKNLGCPDTVLIHLGSNYLKRKRNFDYVMREVYDLVAMALNKFPRSRLVLSGVLRRRDVTWRRIGSINDRYDWVIKTLGISFLDPNSWIEDGDLGRDGLHLNRRGAKRLGHLYSRVCGFGGGRPTASSS